VLVIAVARNQRGLACRRATLHERRPLAP
jgi:hypothetical protein